MITSEGHKRDEDMAKSVAMPESTADAEAQIAWQAPAFIPDMSQLAQSSETAGTSTWIILMAAVVLVGKAVV